MHPGKCFESPAIVFGEGLQVAKHQLHLVSIGRHLDLGYLRARLKLTDEFR